MYAEYMREISATEAKQKFAALLDAAQRGPVRIRRHDREVAVLVSAEEYEKIHRMRVEELIRLSDENGRYADSQGMTGELLDELLANES
jgi:prevent-host-death family protein